MIDVKTESSDAENIKEKATEIVKRGKKYKKYAIILIVMIVTFFVLWTGFNLLPYGLWIDYQTDLIKIAPYIEQHELDMIKSDWVCMRSQEDFEDIYRRIDLIKEEHNLP